MSGKKPPRAPARPPVILRRDERDYAVLVWREDVEGEPVYEVAHDEIKEAGLAATLTKAAKKAG